MQYTHQYNTVIAGTSFELFLCTRAHEKRIECLTKFIVHSQRFTAANDLKICQHVNRKFRRNHSKTCINEVQGQRIWTCTLGTLRGSIVCDNTWEYCYSSPLTKPRLVGYKKPSGTIGMFTEGYCGWVNLCSSFLLQNNGLFDPDTEHEQLTSYTNQRSTIGHTRDITRSHLPVHGALNGRHFLLGSIIRRFPKKGRLIVEPLRGQGIGSK